MTSKSSPLSLEQFLHSLKRNWIEKITFSNDADVGKDAVDAADIPPIIAPVLRGHQMSTLKWRRRAFI